MRDSGKLQTVTIIGISLLTWTGLSPVTQAAPGAAKVLNSAVRQFVALTTEQGWAFSKVAFGKPVSSAAEFERLYSTLPRPVSAAFEARLSAIETRYQAVTRRKAMVADSQQLLRALTMDQLHVEELRGLSRFGRERIRFVRPADTSATQRFLRGERNIPGIGISLAEETQKTVQAVDRLDNALTAYMDHAGPESTALFMARFENTLEQVSLLARRAQWERLLTYNGQSLAQSRELAQRMARVLEELQSTQTSPLREMFGPQLRRFDSLFREGLGIPRPTFLDPAYVIRN